MYYRQFLFLSLLIMGIMGLVSCKGKSEGPESIYIETSDTETVTLEKEENLPPLNYVRGIKVRNIGPLSQVFNDSNYTQLEAARNLGISPVEDLSSAYFIKRPIVKVESNRYYHIDSLRHSLPYLVPEAAKLLQVIGKNFQDSLHKRGGDSYKIKVTSLLRTPETVGRLRKVNVNATDSSTHQFATTFDISYTNFYCLDPARQINQGDLKNLLGEVLNDLRQQGRCLVKYERKTGCFHVTVTQ